MKPIIVTYSNESWVMNGFGYLCHHSIDGTTKYIPGGFYNICQSLTYPPKFKEIFNKDIKLIARPKK